MPDNVNENAYKGAEKDRVSSYADLEEPTEEEILERLREHMKDLNARVRFQVGDDTISIYPEEARDYSAEDILRQVEEEMGEIDEVSVDMEDGTTINIINELRKKKEAEQEKQGGPAAQEADGKTGTAGPDTGTGKTGKATEFDDGMRGLEVYINGKRVDRNDLLTYIYAHKQEFMYAFAAEYEKVRANKQMKKGTYTKGFVDEMGQRTGERLNKMAEAAMRNGSTPEAGPEAGSGAAEPAGADSREEGGQEKTQAEDGKEKSQPEDGKTAGATSEQAPQGTSQPAKGPDIPDNIDRDLLGRAAAMAARDGKISRRSLTVKLGLDSAAAAAVIACLAEQGAVRQSPQNGVYTPLLTEAEAKERFPYKEEPVARPERPKATQQQKEIFRHEFDGIIAKRLTNGQIDVMMSKYKGMRVTCDPAKNDGRITYEKLEAKRGAGGRPEKDEAGNIVLKSRWMTFDEACIFYDENHEKLTAALAESLHMTKDEVVSERGSVVDEHYVTPADAVPSVPEPETISDADFAEQMAFLHDMHDKEDEYSKAEDQMYEESAAQAVLGKKRRAARSIDESRKDGRGSADGSSRIDTSRRQSKSEQAKAFEAMIDNELGF